MKHEKIYEEFQSRLDLGLTKHTKKRVRIKNGRLVGKMELVTDNLEKNYGNNPDGTKSANRSRYQTTLFKAICDSIRRDLTAKPMRFEWGANDAVGLKMKRTYDRILTKAYAYAGTDRERNSALYHLLYSGCSIIQPYTTTSNKKFIDPKTEEEIILPGGRIVSYRSYDPLRTVLDWNANPFDVTGTSDFAIIHVGKYSREQLEVMYGSDVLVNLPHIDSLHGMGAAANALESDYVEVQASAGLQDQNGYTVYEYFLRGGYTYVIVNGYGVVQKKVNSNGISKTIPLFITPVDVDPDSPYGSGMYEMLQQSLDMISTGINQIADVNSRTVKAPTYVIQNLLKARDLSLKDSNPNKIVELNINALRMDGTIPTLDVNRMFGRISFKEVTEGAMFLIKTALDNIWYVTGMNPMSLGGIQEKQIRVSDAASMMQQASLKSSSTIVKNLEVYMLNPLTQSMAEIFAIYYNDFPEFEEAGITEDIAKEVQKHMRVINGSYLPADQFSEMQRTGDTLNVALQAGGNTMDMAEVLIDYLVARGDPRPERLFRDPLTTFTGDQMVAAATMMQQQGAEQFVNYVNQRAQQEQQER